MAIVAHNRLLCITYQHLLLVDSQQDKAMFKLNLMRHPERVCMINKDCAAVTTVTYNDEERYITNNEVHYITIKDETLELGDKVRVSVRGHIMGICTMKDNLAVSYNAPPAVEMITKKGKIIDRIGNDTAGREIFISPWYLTASPDYEHIFVSDNGTHTITMLNPDLQVLNTFSDRNLLHSPQGLTMWNEKVLVCGVTSNSIVLLNPNSGQMSTILDKKDGVKLPVALAFCHQTKTLLFIRCLDELENSIQRYKLQWTVYTPHTMTGGVDT